MFAELLKFLSLHVDLKQEDYLLLLSKLEQRNYPKKSMLINIGEVESNLHFIQKGLARKFFYRNKDEIITHIVKEGGIISSAASFFSQQPSRYAIEALEPTQVYSISKEKLEELFALDNKWEMVGRVITTSFLIRQEQFLMDNIRLTVKERFKKFMTENPDLLQRVPQKQLAGYLNIKQETFSRMKHLMFDQLNNPVSH